MSSGRPFSDRPVSSNGNDSLNDPLFYFDRSPGCHRVGLQLLEQYDTSRAYLDHKHRPLQTLIWYPAAPGGGPAMTVDDYVSLLSTERSFGRPERSARAEKWRADAGPTLAMRLWAVRDAPSVSGRFPIVIYAPGYSGPSWENADLCEYLASHGYIVLASPSMGSVTPHPTLDFDGIEPQVRDISFLISCAQTLTNAEPSQIAVIGFSWGGLCNVVAATRDTRIKALIALDGGLRFHPGLARKADVIPEQMTIPLLSIAQGQWTPEDKAAFIDRNPDHHGLDVLNAWTQGDLVTVLLLGFTHGEHCSMGQRNEQVWKEAFRLVPERKADYGRDAGIEGYGWLARYSLEFLNAYLKCDAAAMAFLKKTPVENGAPARFMTVKFRAATTGSRPVPC